MRRITARPVLIGLALGSVLASFGCNQFFGFVHRDANPPATNPADLPTAAEMVAFLNDNARKVQGLSSIPVDIDVRADKQVVGLSGKIACQKPRDFRLKADFSGSQFVDIGSNSEEFWFWVKQGEVPYVFHCKHSELAQAQALPIPFQPELILAALGVAEFDPTKTYERKVNPDTVELIERIKSPQGREQLKVVVFNRAPDRDLKGKPRVAAYILKDAESGKDICQAVVLATYPPGPKTNMAVVPYQVQLNWPEQKVVIKLRLSDLQVRNYTAPEVAKLFNRADLGNRPSYDLATGRPDAPPGLGQNTDVQRTGNPPR